MKNKSIQLVEESACTGYSSCFNVCPFKTISLMNKDGCWQPYGNEELCTNCGPCIKVCPANVVNPDKYKQLKFYAVTSFEGSLRKKSSYGSALVFLLNMFVGLDLIKI